MALIEPAEPAARARFGALFEACPWAFIQQSTLWADVVAEIGPDRPLFLIASEAGEDVAGLPLYLYSAAPGDILTSVPQPGPLGGVFVRDGLSAERREKAYAALLAEALALAGRLHCIALSLITSPLHDDLALYERHLEPTSVLENFTQLIPLEETVRRSGGQRNNLTRARRFGFVVEECRDEAQLHDWYALHQRRHEAVGAVPLDRRLIENIFRVLLPREKALLLLAKDGERLAAGCLYILHRKVLDVFAISMDSDYAEHAPNALLADRSQAWAKERGVAIYNWQSSPSRTSGVYAHKQQWGSREAPYHFVTRLLCPPERITALGADTVHAAYAGHYLVPFGFFETPGERRFRKH